MKYIIIAPGKFHVKSLVKDIKKFDKNRSIIIISSSPNFFDRNENNLKFYFIPMFFQIVFRKILKVHQPSILKFIDYLMFDLFSSFFVEKGDVVIGFASVSLFSGKKCINLGGKYILDRACPYFPYQYNTISNEYLLSDLSPPKINSLLLKRILNEYEISTSILVPSMYSLSTYPKKMISKIILHKIKINEINFSSKKIIHRNDQIKYGFIGGDYIRKGVNILIDGFSKFMQENDNVFLNIKMNKKEFLKTKKSKDFYNKYFNRIKFISYLKNIGDFYKNIDYLVLPSIDEGFGMVVIESLFCGKPVIISDNVGAKDYVLDNKYNLIFKSNNLNSLKQNLDKSYSYILNNKNNFEIECKKNYENYIKDERNFLRNEV